MDTRWKIISALSAVFFSLAAILLVLSGGSGVMTPAIHPEHKEINEEGAQVSIGGIQVQQRFLPLGYAGRPGITREIKWIVIHETANHSDGADSEAHYTFLMNNAKDKTLSWHYTVDDGAIIHMLPDYEVGWHAGDGSKPGGGNMCGIGIELAVNDDGDFEKTLDNGARLTAYLLHTYGLDLSAVKMHGDFSGKNCPMMLRDSGRWEEFLNLVEKYYIDGYSN